MAITILAISVTRMKYVVMWDKIRGNHIASGFYTSDENVGIARRCCPNRLDKKYKLDGSLE